MAIQKGWVTLIAALEEVHSLVSLLFRPHKTDSRLAPWKNKQRHFRHSAVPLSFSTRFPAESVRWSDKMFYFRQRASHRSSHGVQWKDGGNWPFHSFVCYFSLRYTYNIIRLARDAVKKAKQHDRRSFFDATLMEGNGKERESFE